MKTVNLELSKQLKEAEYPQEGLFMWDMDSKLRVGIGTAQAPHYKTAFPDVLEVEVDNCITSPTADEILDAIKQETDLIYWKQEDKKWVIEMGMFDKMDEFEDGIPLFKEESLADAAAQAWLWLKDEGLL